jgi:hypothetical protein
MEDITKMVKSRSRLSSVPNIEYWTENDHDSKFNVTIDSTYEPMEKQQSDISTNIFRPFRDTCKHCGSGFFVHFFITCSCKANYCCSCVALISDCTTCKQFLGSTCLFTKTQLFNNKISMHKCMFQKEEENSKYSQSLKTLLYTDSVKLYKEISSLLDIFTENKLSEENSNYVFYTILNRLNLVENNLLIHYDRLFEDCLNKTKNKVKINMNYISNVTKITSYRNKKDFGENINLFLQEGQISSERKKKTINITQGYDRKMLYLKFLFTIVVIATLLILIHLFKL